MFVALVASLAGVLYFLLVTEMAFGWKALACALSGAGVALQFGLVEHQLPLAVPILLHVFVGLWSLFHMRLGDASFRPVQPGRIQR